MRSEEINREALLAAVETEMPGVEHFLDLRTGDVLTVVRPNATDAEEPDEIARDNLLIGQRVRDEPGRYEPVPSIAPEAAFRWMQEFASSIADTSLRAQLEKLLSECADECFGAFRRALSDAPERERERWFAFRAEKIAEFIDEWLEGRTT